MNLVIDSNVLVSLFNDTDSHHRAAIEIMEEVLGGKHQAIVSSLSLPEVCGSLARTVGKQKAEEVNATVLELIEFGVFFLEEVTTKRAQAASHFAIGHTLKGADAIIASLAQEKQSALVTFDKELKKKLAGIISVQP
ncbi:MAG TPA: PIN domain-containing protein [Candidatus Nanoarchaeia archaeon]|nr:PIN domain-containing protein [Candidatus Nanoarchaeia archaeon]